MRQLKDSLVLAFAVLALVGFLGGCADQRALLYCLAVDRNPNLKCD